MEKLTLPEPAAGLWAAKRSIVLAIPPAKRSQPSSTTRARQSGTTRVPRPPTTPGSYTTPGANPGTGTPRKSKPAGSRTSKPSEATSYKSHSNKHIPLISKAVGADPETGLKYPERPPSGS